MTKVHLKRLLKLADFLDDLPPKKFNFRHFVGEDWDGDQTLSCGTTACAIGWCATIPSFRRLGAEIRVRWGSPVVALKDYPDSNENYVGHKLFGTTNDQFRSLFVPGTKEEGYSGLPAHSGPKTVAKHIRKFVEKQAA